MPNPFFQREFTQSLFCLKFEKSLRRIWKLLVWGWLGGFTIGHYFAPKTRVLGQLGMKRSYIYVWLLLVILWSGWWWLSVCLGLFLLMLGNFFQFHPWKLQTRNVLWALLRWEGVKRLFSISFTNLVLFSQIKANSEVGEAGWKSSSTILCFSSERLNNLQATISVI